MSEDALIAQDPEPLLDYLVRLAMEALDQTMAQSTPTHRGVFESALAADERGGR